MPTVKADKNPVMANKTSVKHKIVDGGPEIHDKAKENDCKVSAGLANIPVEDPLMPCGKPGSNQPPWC